MSKDALGGADEVGTARLVGGQSHHDGRGEREGDGLGECGPAGQGWALEGEDAEEAAEEAMKRAEARAKEKDLNSEEVAEIESAIARSLAQLKFKRRRHQH